MGIIYSVDSSIMGTKMNKIEKGSLVRVRTTNGGEKCGHLLEDYVPTYRAVVGRMNAFTGGFGAYAIIDATRISSIERVQLA